MKSVDEMCEIMQASKTKEIEFRHKGIPEDQWDVVKIQSWDWSTFDYRVKAQEPRRIWVNEFSCGVMSCFKEKFVAEGFHNASNFIRCDEFIELTPEVREKLGL